MSFFGALFFLRVAPITNSYDYVNEISQRQDYGNDLTKAPCVFARLNDRVIPMDLGHCEYAFRCFGQQENYTTINSRVATPYTAGLVKHINSENQRN